MAIERRKFLKTCGASIAMSVVGRNYPIEAEPVRKAVNLAAIARAHPYRFEDVVVHAERVRANNSAAIAAGNASLPTLPTAPPPVVSLAQYQTEYRNQGLRGSCYAFATCAAMEAAYKRKYGINLHLSEQYAFHLNKAFELLPEYSTGAIPHENISSLWGFQGASDLVHKLAICAIPNATAARYLSQDEMWGLKLATPATGGLSTNANDVTSTQEQLDAFEFLEGHVPTTARHVARYRVASWAALPGTSTTDVETVLAAGYEVIVDVRQHCTLFIGYDRPNRLWQVKNSWAEGGPVYWSYDDPIAQINGGAYITGIADPAVPPQKDAWWIGRWQMDHDGTRGELVIRRTVNFRALGGPTKLGSYYREGKRYEVNGTVIDNGQGLHFWIANTTDRVSPGSSSGQEFKVFVFSHDPFNAAGLTIANGTSYGVSLSRKVLSGKPSTEFNSNTWRGNWIMDHDGLRGILSIIGISPVEGKYRAKDGRTFDVSGSIDGAFPHILNLRIGFPGNQQPFQLACHTRENNVFSGTTQWNGLTFGAKGLRQGI